MDVTVTVDNEWRSVGQPQVAIYRNCQIVLFIFMIIVTIINLLHSNYLLCSPFYHSACSRLHLLEFLLHNLCRTLSVKIHITKKHILHYVHITYISTSEQTVQLHQETNEPILNYSSQLGKTMN